MRPYTEADFLRIRDFLVATYSHFQRSYNWTIERWNFSVSVARTMHAIPMDTWASQIGIWEENDEIVGVVNAEGEDAGEAFLQLADEHLPEALLQEMLTFCEARMGKVEANKRTIQLFVPSGDVRLETMAEGRGFARQAWVDHDGVLEVTGEFAVELPEGYALADGTSVTPEEKGAAHAKAFGYAADPVYPPRAVEGFRRMTETPDYRADLDMHVRAPDGEVAAFATMWYDAREPDRDPGAGGDDTRSSQVGVGPCGHQSPRQSRAQRGRQANPRWVGPGVLSAAGIRRSRKSTRSGTRRSHDDPSSGRTIM